jgi:hypothetical protein
MSNASAELDEMRKENECLKLGIAARDKVIQVMEVLIQLQRGNP